MRSDVSVVEGSFMHGDDVYPCMECQATPFHLECLEPHYQRAHPRPQEVPEKDVKAEEEILQREADDARAQWVKQMTNLSKIAMPRGRKIAGIAAAIVSVVLAVEPFWSTAAAHAPVSLLQ